jgi:hypothetical protein
MGGLSKLNSVVTSGRRNFQASPGTGRPTAPSFHNRGVRSRATDHRRAGRLQE